MSKTVKYSFLLLLTAAIWGFAFVAQYTGGDAVGPFSFNCIRSLLGALVLVPVIALLDRLGYGMKPRDKEEKKKLYLYGGLIGVVLFLATNMQQLGINYGRSAGKAGFITACYLILVPVIGLFLGKRPGLHIWLAVVLAMSGIYMLSVTGDSGIEWPDILLLCSAFAFAVQILLIDRFVSDVDGVRMAAVQFLVCGLLSAVPMFLFETGNWTGDGGSFAAFTSPEALLSILYAGIFSCGVAYTLQIVGQKNVQPTLASLMMSFESVFCVLGGWLILKERLSIRQLCGCLIVFIAILLAQFGEALRQSHVRQLVPGKKS
ncbi:MAG: DMT family transporter [Lachnospiraceae bacterium]|nr:DMT family transporter [Lachnospiraceae bacterium]